MSFKDNIWYPYTQMHDWLKYGKIKTFYGGEGFYFYDKNGDKYLDGISNMWCNVWGFSNNCIQDEMIKQIRLIPHSTIFGARNQKAIELSSQIVKLSKGMHKVFFSDNGSSAVEVALKIATQYWSNKGVSSKRYFISLQGGYHGDTLGAMSVGFVDKYFHPYTKILNKSIIIPKPHHCENPSMELEMTEMILEAAEKIMSNNSDKSIALIMESGAQIAGGITIYPKNYQKKIAELCKKYDILLILDEVATGFGRLGNMIEYIDQRSIPDIVCFGKAITAGYFPLALTLSSKRVFDEFKGSYFENKQLFHGHTYAGHPVGCTAVLENLKLYRSQKIIDKIRKNGRIIDKRLREFEKFSIVKNVRSKGMLGGFDLVNNNEPIKTIKNIPTNYYIMKEAIKKKVLLRSLGNTMILIPPLAISRELLDRIIDVQYELVKKIDNSL